MHRSLISVMLVAVLMAACGRDSDEPIDDPTASTEAEVLSITTGPSQFGEILVDGEGRTLYFLVSDRQDVPTCVEACTGTWSPYPADPEGALGVSIDASMVGQVEHPDGITQVTYNGWPLYRFRDDAVPGDMNGHAAFNAFFAIGPNGGSVGVTE